MVRARTLIAIFCTLAIVPGAAGEDGILVIVNPSNPVTALTKSQVLDLFVRKQLVWDNGRPVTPVDQTNDVREAFSRDVLGMPATSAFAQTQESAAAGGEPPVAVATDREVLAFVRLKPGAGQELVKLLRSRRTIKVLYMPATQTMRSSAMVCSSLA